MWAQCVFDGGVQVEKDAVKQRKRKCVKISPDPLQHTESNYLIDGSFFQTFLSRDGIK